jgi:hypothetical protein
MTRHPDLPPPEVCACTWFEGRQTYLCDACKAKPAPTPKPAWVPKLRTCASNQCDEQFESTSPAHRFCAKCKTPKVRPAPVVSIEDEKSEADTIPPPPPAITAEEAAALAEQVEKEIAAVEGDRASEPHTSEAGLTTECTGRLLCECAVEWWGKAPKGWVVARSNRGWDTQLSRLLRAAGYEVLVSEEFATTTVIVAREVPA